MLTIAGNVCKFFRESLYINRRIYTYNVWHCPLQWHISVLLTFINSLGYLKYITNNFFSLDHCVKNSFECIYKWTINATYFISGSNHDIVNFSNVYQLQGNSSMSMRVRMRRGRQANRQIDGKESKITKTFELGLKVLKIKIMYIIIYKVCFR